MEYIPIIIAVLILITYGIGGLSAAPWLPTKTKQRKKLIDILPMNDGDIIYDLGCGDGSILFNISQRIQNIKAIGFEISLLPYFIAKIKKIFGWNKYKNVTIKFRNLFTQNLKNADIVIIFLFEKSYNKLINKFSQELKDDCLVVVEAWPLPNITPHKVHKRTDDLVPVYFYKGSQFNS